MEIGETSLNGARAMGFVIHRFERQRDEERVMAADGKTLETTGRFIDHDYVVYGPAHLARKQETRARVDRILKATRPAQHSNNLHHENVWARAEYIRPRYEAWLQGIEVDEGKTPLAVATFLSPEEVAVLVENRVKSIEDLADAHPMLLNKVMLPNISVKQRLAKEFMKAKDANVALASIRDQGLEIENLRREIAAMKDAQDGIEDLGVDENGDRVAPKRGRGRPPKPRHEEGHEAA